MASNVLREFFECPFDARAVLAYHAVVSFGRRMHNLQGTSLFKSRPASICLIVIPAKAGIECL